MGIKAGMPDLMIPKPFGGYFGLAIELKIKPNRLSDHQREFYKERLKAYGWKTAVYYDFDSAEELIDDYLRSPLRQETTNPRSGASACPCFKRKEKNPCAPAFKKQERSEVGQERSFESLR